jgi:hypothetical protein
MINLSAKIYVSDGHIIEVNADNMVSLQNAISDREKANLPSWGIVSNGGKISFYDTNSEVIRLIEKNGISKFSRVKIYLTNTLANITKNLGEFYTSKWNYDNDSRLVDITIKDDLEEWQEVVISQAYKMSNFTYLELYYQLVSHTPAKFIISTDAKTLEYLSTITESNPSNLVGDTLWARWQQFAEATMLHIYKNSKGEVVVSNHK